MLTVLLSYFPLVSSFSSLIWLLLVLNSSHILFRVWVYLHNSFTTCFVIRPLGTSDKEARKKN